MGVTGWCGQCLAEGKWPAWRWTLADCRLFHSKVEERLSCSPSLAFGAPNCPCAQHFSTPTLLTCRPAGLAVCSPFGRPPKLSRRITSSRPLMMITSAVMAIISALLSWPADLLAAGTPLGCNLQPPAAAQTWAWGRPKGLHKSGACIRVWPARLGASEMGGRKFGAAANLAEICRATLAEGGKRRREKNNNNAKRPMGSHWNRAQKLSARLSSTAHSAGPLDLCAASTQTQKVVCLWQKASAFPSAARHWPLERAASVETNEQYSQPIGILLNIAQGSCSKRPVSPPKTDRQTDRQTDGLD